MFDKNYTIRKCKRRLEELKHVVPKPETEKDRANKRLILNLAEQVRQERKHDVEIDTQARSYEAAGDLLNLQRGRIVFCGGIGSGHRLGAGKWKYINGKWKKE